MIRITTLQRTSVADPTEVLKGCGEPSVFDETVHGPQFLVEPSHPLLSCIHLDATEGLSGSVDSAVDRCLDSGCRVRQPADGVNELGSPTLIGLMLPQFAFMLGELEISNITAAVLVMVALVFIGSFAVVSLQTGELIKPPKR